MIASISVGMALTLALASAFFFTFSSPSVGQSNTGSVAPEPAEQVDTLKRNGESETTSDDPITDFLAEENWITIPAGTYEIECDDTESVCQKVISKSISISRSYVQQEIWDACVAEKVCTDIHDDPSIFITGRSGRSENLLDFLSGASFRDVEQLVTWVNERYNVNLRLLSPSEFKIAISLGLYSQPKGQLRTWLNKCNILQYREMISTGEFCNASECRECYQALLQENSTVTTDTRIETHRSYYVGLVLARHQ